MLKLSVNNNDELNDIIITEDTILNIKLDNVGKEINIDVMDNMCLEVFEIDSNTNNKINYNLKSNSRVIVNKLGLNNSDNTNINIDGVKASLEYYSSFLNNQDNIYEMSVNNNANYTESNVCCYCVNLTENEFKFLVNSNIKKDIVDCFSNQDSKIIDLGNGKNYIEPNLIVDSDEISANHSAYIGRFKKEDIFYLMSRGIKEKDCEYLLTKGFLLGKMNLDSEKNEEYIKFIDDNFKQVIE